MKHLRYGEFHTVKVWNECFLQTHQILKKIEIERESVTKRARMYFLRKRIGKRATKVEEK